VALDQAKGLINNFREHCY